MDLNQNDDWVGIFERKQIREMDGPAWNWEQKPAVPNAINTRQRRAETTINQHYCCRENHYYDKSDQERRIKVQDEDDASHQTRRLQLTETMASYFKIKCIDLHANVHYAKPWKWNVFITASKATSYLKEEKHFFERRIRTSPEERKFATRTSHVVFLGQRYQRTMGSVFRSHGRQIMHAEFC